MKIGDKVRFLSEVGGGKISGFQGNNIVLVEDEDGFEIPTPINDVVVVGNDDMAKAKITKIEQAKDEKEEGNAKSIKAQLSDNTPHRYHQNRYRRRRRRLRSSRQICAAATRTRWRQHPNSLFSFCANQATRNE